MILGIHGLFAKKNSRYPALSKSGSEMQDLIPDGWQVLSKATGDLNGDEYENIAFVVQSSVKEMEETYEQEHKNNLKLSYGI